MRKIAELPQAENALIILRAWRETVVTKIVFLLPPRHKVFKTVKSFFLVNNGNLGAIARSEQWHLNLRSFQRGQNCP